MIRSGLYTWKEISCAILLSILHKNIAGVFTRIKILLQVILRKFLARVRSALSVVVHNVQLNEIRSTTPQNEMHHALAVV